MIGLPHGCLLWVNSPAVPFCFLGIANLVGLKLSKPMKIIKSKWFWGIIIVILLVPAIYYFFSSKQNVKQLPEEPTTSKDLSDISAIICFAYYINGKMDIQYLADNFQTGTFLMPEDKLLVDAKDKCLAISKNIQPDINKFYEMAGKLSLEDKTTALAIGDALMRNDANIEKICDGMVAYIVNLESYRKDENNVEKGNALTEVSGNIHKSMDGVKKETANIMNLTTILKSQASIDGNIDCSGMCFGADDCSKLR